MQIGEVASGAGLALEAAKLARLAEFARLFLTWNERINLGGAISGTELVTRHFVDSFAASRFVPPNSLVLDVGSGGGLPAIPLALARADLLLHLFEPTGKKVTFLRAAVRELQLKGRVEVHGERISRERVISLGAGVAMSRATWAPTEWLALGRTLLSAAGTVLVFGTGGDGDPREQPREELRYGPGRRLLVYGQAPADRST